MDAARLERGSAVQVLLAVGNPDHERMLVRDLPPFGVSIAGRCLDAPSLVEVAGDPDVALVSADLHRLTAAALIPFQDRGVPVVVLVSEPNDAQKYGALAHLLPASAPVATVAAALLAAADRGTIYDTQPPRSASASASVPSDVEQLASATVFAITSGKAAPGKTTLAIALAAVLADQGSRVVLVDADLRGGNVAPYLDLDPRRGLVGLRGDDANEWGHSGVLGELQDGPGFAVFAGLERPELAAALRPAAVVQALSVLRQRFEYVLVDAGSFGVLMESSAQDDLLRSCDQMVFVAGADLVSLWNAQTALRTLRTRLSELTPAVVVNRREGREHYDGAEIERALDVPLLGVVREDRRAARRAVTQQSPLSAAGGGVASDLRAVAKQLLIAVSDRSRELTAPEYGPPIAAARPALE